MFYITSNIEEDLNKARTTSKPTVFLGGACDDKNKWRDELKKEFGGSIHFIDPYDKNWKPEKNVYNELTGIVHSEYTVFYKGGEGSKKEKTFIDDTGVTDYKEFEDMDKLRVFLKGLSKTVRKSAADVLRSVAAKLNVTYDHCSTQVDLPDDIAQNVMLWGKRHIQDKDLFKDKDGGKGREDEIHVTLMYGIKDSSFDKIKEMVKGVKPFECRLGIITAFKDAKEHDVLKIDVESPELQKLHYLMTDKVENKDSHPTYFPHLTIAYMKKGTTDKYIGDGTFREVTFKVDAVTYSGTDGKKQKIKIGI